MPAFALSGLAVVYLALRHSIISGLSQGQWAAGFTGWLSTMPVILTTYIRQLFWPDPMCIDQPVDYRAGFGITFWLSLLVLAACAIALLVRRETWSRWQFALAFFFVALIPVSGIIPINQPRADRFLYLPSVGAALAVGWLWDWAQPRWRTVCLACIAASLSWFGWRSWDYSKTFLNETALWKNVLVVNPNSYRGYADLAAYANNAGQPQIALDLIEKSLTLNPTYPEGWVIKAYAWRRSDKRMMLKPSIVAPSRPVEKIRAGCICLPICSSVINGLARRRPLMTASHSCGQTTRKPVMPRECLRFR